jgi:glutathione S-transferase
MTLTLYHHPSSPCSAKVRLMLAEKEISWQSQIVDIFRGEQFSSSYLKLNPAGVVPTLVHDERVLRESLVICEYLEEAFPEPPLAPKDFVARARMRVWCKDIETFMVSAYVGVTYPACDRFEVARLSADKLAAFYAAHPNRRLADRKRWWSEAGFAAPDARTATLTYHKFLQKMEMQLGKSRWLAGDSYSLADLETTPYIALLELMTFQNWWQCRLPRVSEWYERVKERPSFRPALVDVIPNSRREAMAEQGRKAWPDVNAILAMAEPFTGRSPWAMRAEAL